VLILGLDLVLGVAVVSNIAQSARSTRPTLDRDAFGRVYERSNTEAVAGSILGGALAMVCLNCLSVPICLVGVGLAIAGLVAHRDRNHLFTWIGLLGNGVVILGIMGLYLLGAVSGQ
jgi:hypothetical protein